MYFKYMLQKVNRIHHFFLNPACGHTTANGWDYGAAVSGRYAHRHISLLNSLSFRHRMELPTLKTFTIFYDFDKMMMEKHLQNQHFFKIGT